MSALGDARAALSAQVQAYDRDDDDYNEEGMRNAAAELLAALSTPPTDDEREALDQCIRDANGHWPQARENILAAGFRRQGPITDAQVEAADRAWDEHSGFRLASMRAALEAARAAS